MNVAAGASFVDACDEYEAPIPFCCRSASCGTCRVELLEGAEHLLPPAEDELDVLDMYGELSSRVRLACQAKLRPIEATVRFRALEDA
jgi:2Fe-2S ferredoxin